MNALKCLHLLFGVSERLELHGAQACNQFLGALTGLASCEHLEEGTSGAVVDFYYYLIVECKDILLKHCYFD